MQTMNSNLKDNYPYGNYLREEKPPWAVRSWLQNPNGLGVSHRMDTVCIIVESMKDVQVVGKYQPGGVALFAQDKIVGRINQIGSDKTGYIVCQQSKAGSETVYSQQ
eukprot:6602883-Ditylum_brightwellii.AAC.1